VQCKYCIIVIDLLNFPFCLRLFISCIRLLAFSIYYYCGDYLPKMTLAHPKIISPLDSFFWMLFLFLRLSVSPSLLFFFLQLHLCKLCEFFMVVFIMIPKLLVFGKRKSISNNRMLFIFVFQSHLFHCYFFHYYYLFHSESLRSSKCIAFYPPTHDWINQLTM
jgi:hypothetical protein